MAKLNQVILRLTGLNSKPSKTYQDLNMIHILPQQNICRPEVDRLTGYRISAGSFDRSVAIIAIISLHVDINHFILQRSKSARLIQRVQLIKELLSPQIEIWWFIATRWIMKAQRDTYLISLSDQIMHVSLCLREYDYTWTNCADSVGYLDIDIDCTKSDAAHM